MNTTCAAYGLDIENRDLTKSEREQIMCSLAINTLEKDEDEGKKVSLHHNWIRKRISHSHLFFMYFPGDSKRT